MTDEYLWDRSGAVDPMIAALEDSLAVLRLPTPLRPPVLDDARSVRRPARRRSGMGPTLATAALATAATGALIWAWVGLRDPSASDVPERLAPRSTAQDRVARRAVVAVPPLPEPVAAPVAAPLQLPAPPPSADPADTYPLRSVVRAVVSPKPARSKRSPSAAEVRRALASSLPRARACGKTHAAADDTVVKVELTIDGATGEIVDAAAMRPHHDDALGRCVAAAVRDATFDPFDDARARVVLPVRVQAAASPPSAPPSGTALVPSLTQQQIKDGIGAVKADAKACGRRHGALPGDKVGVKLSISGADGRVTRAVALGKHHGTPLGKCVAEALSQARFPRFEKASIGVQYPVTM